MNDPRLNPHENSILALRDASRDLMDAVLNTGKRRGPETRAKISRAMTGRRLSQATRRKIGEAVRRAHAGKPKRQFSAEHRENLSKALTGRRLSLATRVKIKKALEGRPKTEAAKRKIGDALRGRVRGPREPRRTPDERRSRAMRASWFLKKKKAEHGGQIPAWLLNDPEVERAHDILGGRR